MITREASVWSKSANPNSTPFVGLGLPAEYGLMTSEDFVLWGPDTEGLELGDKVRITVEKVVEIPVGLRAYKPQVYRGFIITDENDGLWRFYLNSRQIGWADSLGRCKDLIDAQGEKSA